MSEIVDAVNGAFEALFYGAGSWLGILLLLSITLGLLLKWKYSGALLLPITIFLGIDYVAKDLLYHALIVWFAAIFILLFMCKQLK